MNNLAVVTEYIDIRNGKKRYFDQYEKEYETLNGLNGLFSTLREKAGDVFSNVKTFLKKTSQKVVGVFQPRGDGTIEKVSTPGGALPIPTSSYPPLPAVHQASTFGMDNKTLMIGGILLLGGLWYYKSKR